MIYKLPQNFIPSFESTGLSVQQKFKIDFQDGCHLEFPIRRILAIFDLQVTSIHPLVSSQSAFRFRRRSSTKKVREKSRECHNHKPQPFPDIKRKRKPTNPNKHKSIKHTKSTKIKSPRYFKRNFESIGLSIQKFKIDFQDGGRLGFPIRIFLGIFDLQVALILLTKFRVNWPFRSTEEVQNRFSR